MNILDRLDWLSDRVILDDLVFKFQNEQRTDTGEDCFIFRKTKHLIDQYEIFWKTKPEFKAKNIVELGIFDGGSIAFWNEYFHPDKHIAIDIKNRDDSSYFKDYVKTKHLKDKVKTYWNTDQADKSKLVEIINSNFDNQIDLVIDDASHMYDLTKCSFHILFPLMRPNGLYIIEDWAWAHWEEFQKESHPWSRETPLTKLICELVEVAGTSNKLIGSLSVFQGFVAIERGNIPEGELNEFQIMNWISRKQETSIASKILNKFTT